MLRDLLAQQRRQILDRWTERVLDTYPRETAVFLKGERDRFRNPVGYTVETGLAKIYDALLGNEADSEIERAVEDIVRMRAVQEFSPSQAVGFGQPLKEIVADAIKAAGTDRTSGAAGDIPADFSEFEAQVDRVTLRAVDCYVKCREEVFQTSLREARAGGMVGSAMRDRSAH
jgi:hypothetical protein